MKRIVLMDWKDRKENTYEVFSNLKLLCESYPEFNYNTLNNYLSKNKIAYITDRVRIERKIVHTKAIPPREMAKAVHRVSMKEHNDHYEDTVYWMSRPARERLEAVARLRAQFLSRGQRMDKSMVTKRKS